ncbi:hypothetical protein [Rickettsia conorii]|uniref:hypothetical protein n=1 Tax=Rickettsia conorii TaxID=781 RepID=UPI002260B327|nr:hypothetical protein [Rickettsia conorii]UZW39183.1 hypothetical protein OSR38_02830 [Rickettsia conorii subsp. heilongjiangensis]
MKKYKFTEKEQEILDYFEQDELLELPKKELESQKNIAKIAAANFFKNRKELILDCRYTI